MVDLRIATYPRGKARHRLGNGVHYTPTFQKHAEWEIRTAFLEGGHQPLSGPLGLWVQAVLPRPKHHYGRRGLLPSAPEYPTGRPDIDNLVKTVLDALNGVAWKDDSQIVSLLAGKVYGESPGWRLTIAHWPSIAERDE